MKDKNKLHEVIELEKLISTNDRNIRDEPQIYNNFRDSVQLISFEDEESGNIILHENNLLQVLDMVPPDMPVSIISIIGAFRTGKSFILNILLKFLESYSSNIISTTNSNNIIDKLQTVPGNKNCFGSGFVWCNGIESQTMGIWIWNRPIIYNHPKDGKIAIVLMDTQGLFDLNTNQKKTITLFGMSALISSHVIYNVDKRIQEDNLQHLALFSAYGQLVNKSIDKGKCLQTLQFLVRDWQNFDEMDTNQELGEFKTFSERYLEQIFCLRSSKDLNNTRNQIMNCFEKITCSFLPHPGLKATSSSFKGNFKELNKDFIKNVKNYINETFIENSLDTKKVGGIEIKANEIFNLIKNYLTIFQNEKGFPKATTILESTIMIQHSIAIEKGLSHFRDSMESHNYNNPYYLLPNQFNNLIHKNMLSSCDIFLKNCTLGDSNVIQNSKIILENRIEEQSGLYRKLNDERRPLKFFGPYIIPLFGIIFSLILSKLFATCSTSVTICYELYFLFSVSYYLSITVMVIFFLVRYYIPSRKRTFALF
ncbi:Guanylate-binding protein, N-terminal domain [seawater metagenome]|uniref:Guanylate-binding protein, N-terminal domain n=1 Tax=seawater metagenome TaxID=1561972 RepID=A0A5E8CJR5_9ZZZZ